jgi:hypothetical protein
MTPPTTINNTENNHLIKKLEPEPQVVRNFIVCRLYTLSDRSNLAH